MKIIALVAHDNKKNELVEWTQLNRRILSSYTLYATGGTGKMIIEKTGLNITLSRTAPMGEIWNLALS